jgi:hypothetical protein
MTDKKDSPGTSGEAHGASEDFLADASDNTANGETGQDREPRSRYDLIRYHSLFCLFDEEGSVGTYDTVPDRARTDLAIGTVEMCEELFLALASIVESLNGGWAVNIMDRVSYEFKNLIAQFGDDINVEVVEELIIETLKNEEVISDCGGSNVR